MLFAPCLATAPLVLGRHGAVALEALLENDARLGIAAFRAIVEFRLAVIAKRAACPAMRHVFLFPLFACRRLGKLLVHTENGTERDEDHHQDDHHDKAFGRTRRCRSAGVVRSIAQAVSE